MHKSVSIKRVRLHYVSSTQVNFICGAMHHKVCQTVANGIEVAKERLRDGGTIVISDMSADDRLLGPGRSAIVGPSATAMKFDNKKGIWLGSGGTSAVVWTAPNRVLQYTPK